MSNLGKVQTYMANHPRLSTAVRSAKYGAGVALISAGLGGFAGLIPSLTTGYIAADRFGRNPSGNSNPLSFPQKAFKLLAVLAGALSVLQSDSVKVVFSFLASSLLVLGLARLRNNPAPKVNSIV